MQSKACNEQQSTLKRQKGSGTLNTILHYFTRKGELFSAKYKLTKVKHDNTTQLLAHGLIHGVAIYSPHILPCGWIPGCQVNPTPPLYAGCVAQVLYGMNDHHKNLPSNAAELYFFVTSDLRVRMFQRSVILVLWLMRGAQSNLEANSMRAKIRTYKCTSKMGQLLIILVSNTTE